MGLFDRFKKQKNEEVPEEVKVEVSPERKEEAKPAAEPEAPAVPVEEKKEEQEKDNEVRRFTLLVENLSVLPEEQGVVIGGFLHGTVQEGDDIYVIHPTGSIVATKVNGIEVGPNQTAARAKDQKITIFLKDMKEAVQVPKYTVITSIKPQTTVDLNTAVENPQLLGLSMEYPRLYKDQTYFNLLIYVVCHAHYVVPARIEADPVDNGDGTATMQKSTKMHFPSLQDPADKSKNVFPVFTDWQALANWKNLFDEEHPPKSIIMRIPDVVSVSKGNGIVINPFGPVAVMISDKLMAQIVTMDGYKQEFGGNAADTVQKVEAEQGTQVVVGVPKDNEEIKLIKEALVTQAKNVEEIKRVDFLLKVDMQKERAYLCIVDCPEEQAEKYFTGLHKATAPYFNEVKRLEFLLYGKTKLANDVVNEKSCIYQA